MKNIFFAKDSNKRLIAYAGLIFVIIIWGLYPIFAADLLTCYSPSIFTFVSSLISGIALLVICIPRLKLLDLSYFKVAVPTGCFFALANLFQKIGLPYTTPTQYAFLENLSCVVVPILLFIFIRKKTGVLTIAASVLCLAGCFVLSGLDLSSGGVAFGKGEILCALAGVFYGVNIAATGAYAKKLYAPLYVMIQMWMNVAVSLISAVVLNRVQVNGAPIEQIRFLWEWKRLLFLVLIVLSVSALGWVIRTAALKYVNASVVAIMMPFSAAITGVCDVVLGTQAFTLSLILGGTLVVVSSILSSIDDVKRDDRKRATDKTDEKDDKSEDGGGNGTLDTD